MKQERLRELWRASKLRHRDTVKKWRVANRERSRIYRQRDRAKNPEKWRARRALERAKRRGEFQVFPCFICGATPTEAHHISYENPIIIVQLCRKHHAELHRKGQGTGTEPC